jgi:hypothetical protein
VVFLDIAFLLASPTNILHAFLFTLIRVECPVLFILLDFIVTIMLGEEYKLGARGSVVG